MCDFKMSDDQKSLPTRLTEIRPILINWSILRYLEILGDFQYMVARLVNDKQFAPKNVSLASKLPRGQRPKYANPCFCNKTRP